MFVCVVYDKLAMTSHLVSMALTLVSSANFIVDIADNVEKIIKLTDRHLKKEFGCGREDVFLFVIDLEADNVTITSHFATKCSCWNES